MIFYVGCCGLLVAGSQGSPRSGSSLYLTMRNVWISTGFPYVVSMWKVQLYRKHLPEILEEFSF